MPRSDDGRSRRRMLPALAAAAALWLGAALPAGAADKAPEKAPDKPVPAAAAAPAASSAANPAGNSVANTALGQGEELPSLPFTGGTDPIVASVEGRPIYLSDLGRAERGLPENLRSVPFDALYPVLLDRMVDHEALVMRAKQRGLEDNPVVKKQIQDATERVLEGAILALDAAPKVTEEAIKARYNQLYANHPATEEVRARHILVTTEAEAKDLIAQLKKGADFATLAKQTSKDPDGQKGGDLGFFRREQVWPGFADVAFALQPGQVADQPIHNEFGWHVIKVEERRLVAPPSYPDVREALREELMQDAVRQVVAQGRAQLTIHKWNVDGSSMDGTRRLGDPAPKPTK